MTNQPTIAAAYARLGERKTAAGIPVTPLNAPVAMKCRDHPGILAGTDLTVDDLDGVVRAFGMAAVPLALAHGLVEAAGSIGADGLLTGLELAAMRAEIEDHPGRIRTLQTRLVNMAELALSVTEPGGLSPQRCNDLAEAARGILEEAGRR